MTTILSIQNLSKSFSQHQVLHNVNLELRENTITGLIGESGSGKTTLAKILVGLEQANSGTILLDGNNITTRKDNIHNIQFIFQNAAGSFNPKFTLYNNLMESLNILKHNIKLPNIDKTEYLQDKCIEFALSPELLHKYPHEISGGQIQRFAIMRAILAQPQIIIADEPTSALDICNKLQILDLFVKLKEQYNLSILFVTHDITSLKNIAHDIYIIEQGYIVEHNTTYNILQHPQHLYTKTLIQANIFLDN